MEKLLFTIFGIIFFSLGCFIALNSSVIDSLDRDFDVYFDFDNPYYVKNLFQIQGHRYTRVAHPLISIVLFPVELICEIVLNLFGPKSKTIAIVFFTATSVSASILFVYKYLKNVIQLNSFRSLLLSVLFGIFANSIVTSFTPESYPFSMCLLTFALYYFSINMKNKKKIPDSNIFLLTFAIGGITITNAVKVLIPIFFFKNMTFFEQVKKYAIYIGVFLTLTVLTYTLAQLVFGYGEGRFFTNKLYAYYTEFSVSPRVREIYKLPYGQAVVNYFWGAPILFSEFSTVPLWSDLSGPLLYIRPFPHFWQYITIGSLFLLSLWSAIRNYRLFLVKILVLYFSVDVFIHLILKWGFYNSLIFGGHWVFLVPLIIGWLYSSLNSERWRNYLDYFLVIILLFVLGNNIFGMLNFIDFALTNYGI